MANILINKVKYEGTSYYFESPQLTAGLNIIEGSNGSGKSTFMNLIYFALSGTVQEFRRGTNEAHIEITSDTENFVELDVVINDKGFLFQRYIDRNDIIVIPADGDAKILPINRSKNEKFVFSDWMLETLGITAVEVFQGVNHFKINFRDMLRLIFHDQELNPRKIYKSADFDNIISDSELVRKIIFQLLLGKSFSDYYSTLAKQKEAEKDVSLKKALLDEYTLISRSLKENGDDLNLTFLNAELLEKESQHMRLAEYRASLKIDRPTSGSSFAEISQLKSDILNNELKLNSLQRKESESLEELSKLYQLKENLILEVTQIKKIIHSHDKLSLFSADTCPYCLRLVDRVEGHCVCGSKVEENQYERFFYNSEEYLQIFKAKQKTVETIDLAINSSIEEADDIKNDRDAINQANETLKDNIRKLLQDVDSGVDSSQLNKVDDQILATREKIRSLKQRIEVEKKLNSLQGKYDAAMRLLEELRDKARTLELASNADIRAKVDEFNLIYNDFMTNTLKNCRSAKIDIEDYMPVINNGEYREASSTVPVRLMYYLTLIKMSIINDQVKFPKFLLIDTPETAGIDEENLLKGLSQISKLNSEGADSAYQIILSSALNKYPVEFSEDVFLTLTDDDRLLKKRNAASIEPELFTDNGK
jgi:DNA repair exonuclease SbcCD ATPase subunit